MKIVFSRRHIPIPEYYLQIGAHNPDQAQSGPPVRSQLLAG